MFGYPIIPNPALQPVISAAGVTEDVLYITSFLWCVTIGSCRPVANTEKPKLVLLQKLASGEVYSECCIYYFSTTFHF